MFPYEQAMSFLKTLFFFFKNIIIITPISCGVIAIAMETICGDFCDMRGTPELLITHALARFYKKGEMQNWMCGSLVILPESLILQVF